MFPPNSKLTRLADPTAEPLSLAEAKAYLKMEWTTADDDFIADCITAARLECERINGRSFLTTSWKFTLDSLQAAGPTTSRSASGWWNGGGPIVLPMPPLIALQSIRYVDMGGTARDLDLVGDVNAVIVSPGTPGRIAPGFGRFFPFSQQRIAAIDIIYTAGYGTDPASVPKSIKMAMRLLVAHYHQHRTSNAEVPDAVQSLLDCTRWGG